MTLPRSPRWRAPLVVQAACLGAAWVGARLMIGYRALEQGTGALGLGVVAASFALPALLAALPAGRISDRVGGMRLVVAGIAIQSASTCGAALTPSLPWLIAASICVGLGQLLSTVGQQSFIAEQADRYATDGAFGTLTSAASIGQIAGPLVATWTATANLRSGAPEPDTTVALFVAALLTLLAIPSCLFLNGLPRHPSTVGSGDRQPTGSMLRIPGLWRALFVSGVVLSAMDMLYAFLPAWAAQNSVPVTVVGWLLALRAGVTLLSRLGLSAMVTRWGRKPLLLVALSAAAVALATLPLVGAIGAIGAMIALGIGLGLPQPLTMAWVVARAEPHSRGAALGLRLTSNRTMQIGIPIVVGAAAGPLGASGIFWASAGLLTGAAAVVGSAGAALNNAEAPDASAVD
jgi:MFS family permease